ncbi:hypothetical protein [Erwinia billingiae]|uniref:hypothetical protein n=1 Tax=Erwinia billingiae TaxID=182337 RepID=UPI00224710CA|nr:hypothetical protein [Erwinia billingiae]MCX0497620.1 hypothetical protein [Erwinia billingiae]
MNTKKIYAVDSTTSVNRADLTIDNKSIDLRTFFPKGFRGKLILNFEEVDNLDESFIYIKESFQLELEKSVYSDLKFELNTNDTKVNNFYDESISIKLLEGKRLFIFSSTDIPYVAKGHIPESKRDYVEIAKIFNLYVVISDEKNSSANKIDTIKNSVQVFDAYGALGFVIVDIDAFDGFISAKAKSNDLVEEFTTTEIASEIFDEGLMILSWGHTPWVYYINSSKHEDLELLIGEYAGYRGVYKFREGVGKYSIIPGNELQDWNACKKKIWPSIEINGIGGYVCLKLYVKNAFSQSDSDYPVPTFYLKRFGNVPGEIEPLLQTDILKINYSEF